MRLWYQSFARPDSFGPYADTVRTVIERSADPGTEIELHGMVSGGFADQYRFVELVDTREVLRNAAAAQRAGFDAYLIGNITDPGLAAARELLDIPVLGLCESSLHVACLMGRRIGIVAPNAKFGLRVQENVLAQGLGGRLAHLAVMRVGVLTDLGAAFEPGPAHDAVLEQFQAGARECTARGADVLLAGGGVVMALLTAAGVREVDGAPVLDGVTALVKVAELAVRLREITGSFTSHSGAYAPPTGTMLARICAEYGDLVPSHPLSVNGEIL
jgi:allantoin racemase